MKRKTQNFQAALLFCLSVLIAFTTAEGAQTKKAKSRAPVNELAKLREEFILATKEYQANLAKLLAIHEKNVRKAESRLEQSKKLFEGGLISRNQLAESESLLASEKDKVSETRRQIATADTQIADTLLEAKAEAQIAKTPLRRGSLMSTASYIRYAGGGGWALADAWKVQRFFSDSFKKPLPVGNFGQGAIHVRWRLDHSNAMDVSLHPDSPEGQALLAYLRTQGIPFLAFRSAIPGTSTGPHIHVGRPSHRY